MQHTPFRQQVTQRLSQLAKRLRINRALVGAGAVATVVLLMLALQFALDYTLRLQLDMRCALLGLVLVVIVWMTWRKLIQPQRLKFDERDIARIIEGRFPQLDSILISAVDFDSGHVGPAASNSPQLAESVVTQAVEATKGIAFEDIIRPKPARQGTMKVLAVMVVGVVLFAAAPQTMGIWLDRNILLRNVNWPKRTTIVVDAPDDRIITGAIGDDLEIRASIPAGSVVPRNVEIVFETKSGKSGRETMTGVGQREFRYTFGRAKEEVRFFLTGGDDTTEWFETRLTKRPTIDEATLSVEPPAYTGIAPYTLPSGQRACEIYSGSVVSIRAITSKPLASARLMNGTEVLGELETQDQTITASVTPTESQTLHFDMTDLDGLSNVRPMRFSIRLLKDNPPQVKLSFAHVGNMATLAAKIPVEIEMTDDLGLGTADLLYRIDNPDAAQQSVELSDFNPRSKQYASQFDWPVKSTKAAIGEQVAVYAKAQDLNSVSGPGVGESTTITFRVVTKDEFLAELNRREQEFRRQFERAVDNQERLRRRLLTVLSHMDDPKQKDQIELELAPLERRQRQVLAQVNVIRQQFAQVLSELEINQLDEPEIRERLEQGIITPLTNLAARELSQAADLIRQLGREPSMDIARQIDPQQDRILDEMRSVLDHMLKWEGFQQTVTLLREIMQLQEELNVETQAEIEAGTDDVFDD
ncbi:MAG: hypothetical protein DHS20C16_11030 [Phycisphaerae bacterium]|nr:MAG: hypothetical protein DHS20C16_11030 [Phycisphaerae bacterium]